MYCNMKANFCSQHLENQKNRSSTSNEPEWKLSEADLVANHDNTLHGVLHDNWGIETRRPRAARPPTYTRNVDGHLSGSMWVLVETAGAILRALYYTVSRSSCKSSEDTTTHFDREAG